MKHQFNFNPLATAIFTLLCGSTVSSYADIQNNPSNTTNSNLKSALDEAYPGQKFFEQFYVDKNSPEAQQRNSLSNSARLCKNTWLTPISPDTKAVDPANATTVITSDDVYYNPNGDSEITGNVVIDQQGRMVSANRVVIDKTQTFAKAEGNVQIAQAGLLAQSDSINYNLKQQTGQLTNSHYISEATHGHGSASTIDRTSPTVLSMKNATFTTCPPEKSPTWKIQAKEITLNQDTGRGVTKGTKLYVKNTPIIALPYFNFPIDDRRTTGLLTPNFGFSNRGGFEFNAPIYLNLAPNYDATITPRFISERGLMTSGEFRYLTEGFGQGKLWGSYLANDKKYNDEVRSDFHFRHNWQINDQFSTNLEYNYVSDKDFFSDLDSNLNTRTELNQRQSWELNYANGIPGLKAKLRIEDFKTLDPSIPDVERPYARLPQFLLNYVVGDFQGLQFEFNNDTAYFRKKIDANTNPTSSNSSEIYQPSGTRFYNELYSRYNFRNQWSFLIPQVGVRSLYTMYDQNTIDRINFNERQNSENSAVIVPEFSLDAGLTFEKEGKYLQTISPRAFYAYAPYKDQSKYPNFDSTTASLSYDQLFNARRFFGHDRLEDNNFLSLGVSYSLFDTIGLERLRASIGQSFYFQDRKVTLDKNNDFYYQADNRTGPIISIASQLSQNFSINANSVWMSNGDNAQAGLVVNYTGDKGNIYNLGYYKRQKIDAYQQKYDQVTASFIQPVKDNWSIMGHLQYDIKNNVAQEYILGLNYQSCCWGVSVYGRSYYNDLDDISNPNLKPNRGVMAEFTLKGLGGLNNKLSSLLENRILGFDKVKQNWTN